MPTVKVRNLKNKEVGEVQLSDAVFDAPFNEPLIHAAVRNFMANARQGTSATKTRGDVRIGAQALEAEGTAERHRIAAFTALESGGNTHVRSLATGPTTAEEDATRSVAICPFRARARRQCRRN